MTTIHLVQLLRLSAILVGKRKRPLSAEKVASLADSIRLVGLLNPIQVTEDGALVAGLHRLEACRRLGWEEIPAVRVEVDALRNRLAEIDENLIRNDLTVLEQSEHLAEREEILAAMGAREQSGANRFTRDRGDTVSPLFAPAAPPAPATPPPKTTADIAREAGLSERDAQRRKQIARDLTPEVKEAIRNTPVADSTTALLDLSRVKDPEKQKTIATKLAAGDARTVSEARGLIRQETKRETAAAIAAEPPPMPEGPYRVIVIDPPWRYEKRAEDTTHRGRNPYPDMTIEEICALPVFYLAHEDCILWLWTTNAFMRQAYQCLDAWGFAEKTILTWAKDRMGTGDWLRGQTEHCILAVKGRPIVTLTNQTTLLRGPLREHSRKPDEFYALVEALCPGVKLEMFARETRLGWASWGGEAGKLDGR